MGGRGAFVDVSKGNFSFVEGGQLYNSIGEVNGVKVLMQKEGAVKAPEYSHSEDSSYAIVQEGKLKHIAFYGKDHKQKVCIDLTHSHNGIIPHKHFNLDHSDSGIPLTDDEKKLIKKIKRRFNLA